MEGNKDEALRCVRIAEEAIASRNKDRALKFLKIAQRLNRDLPLQSLLDKCNRLDSHTASTAGGSGASLANGHSPRREGLDVERNYTEENVHLIREIKGKSDYYAILGLEKSCSVEEIRKAYRKLSLKVHPDKNKAPGSEDAFKKVSKAFKCLSDDGSRRMYDQTGTAADDFESTEVNTFRRRRRRTATTRDFFEDEFDPDEIFRAFFGHSDVFGRNNHVYRTRGGMGNPNHQHRHEFNAGGSGGRHHNVMLLIQLLPFLIIVLLAYLPFSEPEYSLHKHYSYQIPKTTDRHGVQFFVKSAAFDVNYPPGSDAREAVEEGVMKDYRSMLRRYCQVEMQRRSWNRNLPAPHCDKLHNFAVMA